MRPYKEAIDKLADGHGVSSSQFALAWCMQVPGVTCPIIGPRTVEQLRDNMKALNVTLSAGEMKAVDELNPPGELCRDRGVGPVPR